MSDYISKSAFVKALKNNPKVFEQFGHIKSIALEDVVATVNAQPTLDEKDIIRKPMERILTRLEKLPYAEDDGFVWLEDAKDVVKEEGGIE